MGCGCARPRRSRADRLKANYRKNRIDRTSLAIAGQKYSICNKCQHSAQTTREKKSRIKICHKTKRLITTITNDRNFNCPIGKFKSIR